MSTTTVPNSPAKIEVSWDQVLTGELPESPARILFREVVETVTAQAHTALPEANGRVDRARELVLAGAVTPTAESAVFRVRSQSETGTTYTVNGTCNCPDDQKERPCKHRIGVWIWRRARKIVDQQRAGSAEPTTLLPAQGTPPAADNTQRIPAQFLVELHGKQFVTFGGLLAMAHEQGLLSLKAEFLTVTGELALAHATATFQDGRTFEESADATPANVNAKIRPHFPRMALTRAKARALRDALNISMVALEELGD
jgi:hypothetical protein